MFAKLLNYELKMSLRYYVYCFMLSLIAVLALIVVALKGDIKASGGIILLSVILQSTALFAVQILALVRFWRGFYGREAYFQQSLPLSVKQQYWAKVIISSAIYFFHLFFLVLSHSLIILFVNPANERTVVLQKLDSIISDYCGFGLGSLILILTLAFILNGIAQAINCGYVVIRGHSGRFANAAVISTIFVEFCLILLVTLLSIALSLIYPLCLYFGDKLSIALVQRANLGAVILFNRVNLDGLELLSDDPTIIPLAPYFVAFLFTILMAWRTINLLKNKYELRN
ncbi:MAG: hypothetical protein Q4P08_05725 [Eubacteriales bacterium]|nr:hypothetical protein [Eubacteriales bacterium]